MISTNLKSEELEEAKKETLISGVPDTSVALTNETDTQSEHNNHKNTQLSEKEPDMIQKEEKEKVKSISSDSEYEQIMQIFYSTYCR